MRHDPTETAARSYGGYVIGARLSHYRILEPLGAGGMGVVYRARDERLERDVAIKMLPAGALENEAARQRFRKEARALSKLNHPYIGAVHDLGSHEGADFLVLELVPGETLSDRLRRGPLPERDIASLGMHLAEGLAAAHEEGVLHRDIKPGNLRVTPKGTLKVLDFGLAKRIHGAGDATVTESLTAAGQVAGTVPYMSPEQLRGEVLDARSDVYAAGAVLYEMAVGARAFPQEPATRAIGAILHEPPVAPREAEANISANLERIILRCLEKEPGRRYSSASDLGADLREIAAPSVARGRMQGARRWRSRLVAGGIVGAALVAVTGLVVALNVGGVRNQIFGGGTAIAQSLAVLPLANLSGDPSQEYFTDGMTDELITCLAQVGGLRVISRTSAMQYKGTKKSLRRIAKELGVRLIVEGSVLRAGSAVRISAALIDAARERPLWAERYERDLTDVLSLQSDVARAIVQRIAVKLTPQERGLLAASRRVDPRAHEAYLRGRFYYNQYTLEGSRKAIAEFQQAVDLDPMYATAYAGLAEVYCAMSSAYIPASEAMPRARVAALKALEIDPQLAGAYVSVAYIQSFYEWDWIGGERSFRRALDLNPGEASAHAFYGQHLMFLGTFKEASSEIGRAQSIDPLSHYFGAMRLWPLYYGRRYDDAIVEAKKLTEVDPRNHSAHWVLGQSLAMQGGLTNAIVELASASRLDRRPFYLGWLGWAYGRTGDAGRARDILRQLRRVGAEGQIHSFAMAAAFTGLGESDSAFAWLSVGVEQRAEDMLGLKVDPAFDSLRNDPRFKAILKRMNLGS